MFGKTEIDQRSQNLAVGSTLVADQVFVKNLNFNESNYIHGIREDLPVELVEGEFHALPYDGSGLFKYTARPRPSISTSISRYLLYTNDNNNFSNTDTCSVYWLKDNEKKYIIKDAYVKDLNLGVSVRGVKYEHVLIGDKGTTLDSIEVPDNGEICLECTCEIKIPRFKMGVWVAIV